MKKPQVNPHTRIKENWIGVVKMMKYMVYAKDYNPENDIKIECNDMGEMNKYAEACRKQGYKEVWTEVEEG